MSKLYDNALLTNNGFRMIGQMPIDDRAVWAYKSDIFVDGENPKSASLFNKAYTGIQIVVKEENTVTLMVCKNAEPYTPGYNITVNEDNYKEYWSILGSDIYDKIEDATYFNIEGVDDDFEMIDNHGNLKKGTTISYLKTLTISEILKMILFEVVDPKLASPLSVSCAWKNYSTVQEIGSDMPTVNNIAVTFNPETYKCTSSAGTVIATYLLNKINESNTVKYYKDGVNATTGGDDMSGSDYASIAGEYVQEGTHYCYTNVAYDAYQDAVSSDGKNVVKMGYSGTKATSTISFTGVYRIFTNASNIYANMVDAWNAKTTPVPSWNADTKKSGALMSGTVKTYLKWPNGTTSDEHFYIYVPVGHSITSIKAANNTTVAYDLAASVTKQSDTVVINTTNGHAQGTYDVYEVTKATGYTNVEVTIN